MILSDISQITVKSEPIVGQPATDGKNFALRPSDSSDLVIRPSLEAHLTNFVVIQTHLSCPFHRAVDYLGLRRNGSSS